MRLLFESGLLPEYRNSVALKTVVTTVRSNERCHAHRIGRQNAGSAGLTVIADVIAAGQQRVAGREPEYVVARYTEGAVVDGCVADCRKSTVPGPLTLLQVTVSVLPAGKPSSLALPLKLAAAGSVID